MTRNDVKSGVMGAKRNANTEFDDKMDNDSKGDQKGS